MENTQLSNNNCLKDIPNENSDSEELYYEPPQQYTSMSQFYKFV